jgi:hypothetical protein
MDQIFVVLKKGKSKKAFPMPKSHSLCTLVDKINELNLSLEEAEEKAKIKTGTILEAIKRNAVLKAMDAYSLSNALM